METKTKSPFQYLITSLRNNQQFSLFVGAGISFNAGIPIGNGVIKILRSKYPDKFKKSRNYTYSDALNIVFPGKEHQADRRRFFEDLFTGKVPTAEHYLISHLVEHRVFSTVLTTNFDHLTEIALINSCSLQPRIYLHDDDIEPQEFSDVFPKLLKLHGDYLFEDLANLEEEMISRMNRNMRGKLLNHLQEHGLVVVGYGGNDETIMNLLEETVSTKEGLKNGLLWVIYDKDERNNPRLKRLIRKAQLNDKYAEIIKPTDTVRFFKNISSNLDLGFPKIYPFGINPNNSISSFMFEKHFLNHPSVIFGKQF